MVVIRLLWALLTLLSWLILVRAVVSWVEPNPHNPLVVLLFRVTEPVLRPIRRHVPPSSSGIDFSPIIALVLIWMIKMLLLAI